MISRKELEKVFPTADVLQDVIESYLVDNEDAGGEEYENIREELITMITEDTLTEEDEIE